MPPTTPRADTESGTPGGTPARPLTDAECRAARVTGARYQLVDGKVEGLALRVGATGGREGPVRTWSLLYRYAGQRRRINLGRWPAVSVKAARDAARDILARVRHGEDPEGERVRARAIPTLAAALELYLTAREGTVAPRTVSSYRQVFRRHVVPHLGRKLVPEVTLADVRALHGRITRAGCATAANRTVEALRAFYSWARVEWPESCNVNPSRYEGFRRNAEARRERLILPDERERLLGALGTISTTYANAIRLALVTGMRPVDLCTLRHEQISRVLAPGDRRLWVAQWAARGEGRTKKAGQRRVLNSAAIEIIEAQAAITGGHGWVFPTSAGTQSSSNQLARTFRAVRRAAGVDEGVSLYASRHTYISEGVMAGIPLPVIGADVDNASAVHRYAHLQRAVEQGTSELVLAALRRR